MKKLTTLLALAFVLGATDTNAGFKDKLHDAKEKAKGFGKKGFEKAKKAAKDYGPDISRKFGEKAIRTSKQLGRQSIEMAKDAMSGE